MPLVFVFMFSLLLVVSLNSHPSNLKNDVFLLNYSKIRMFFSVLPNTLNNKNMVSSNINEDSHFDEIIFSGKLTLARFNEIIKKFVDEHNESNLKILQNFDGAIFDISYTEVKDLVATSLTLLDKYTYIKTASVVQTHNELAMNMLYGAMMNNKYFQQKNFTDREVAIAWLIG